MVFQRNISFKHIVKISYNDRAQRRAENVTPKAVAFLPVRWSDLLGKKLLVVERMISNGDHRQAYRLVCHRAYRLFFLCLPLFLPGDEPHSH